MKNWAKIGLIALTSTALIGGMAYAEKGNRGGKIVFEAVDTNSDGFVTQAELEAAQALRFANRDTNGDGFVTEDELRAGFLERAEASGREIDTERLDARVAKIVRAMDIDNDGKLSPAEASQGNAARFIERIDTDGDGKISVAEMKAGKAKFKERKEKRDG